MGAIIDKNKMNKLPSSIGLGGRLLDYVCGENEESIPMWARKRRWKTYDKRNSFMIMKKRVECLSIIKRRSRISAKEFQVISTSTSIALLPTSSSN